MEIVNSCKQDKKEIYYQMFCMSSNALVVANEDGILTEVNTAFTLITGYFEEEVLGVALLDLELYYKLEDKEKIRQLIFSDDKIQEQIVAIRTKSGKIAYIKIQVSKTYLSEKLHYMLVGQDVSELVTVEKMRKKQFETMLVSRNKLSTPVAVNNIGSFEYDLEKKHFEFSEELYAILGTTSAREGKFITWNKYIHEFVHPEDVWMFMGEKGIQEAATINENIVPDLIHRITRRDGKMRTVFVKREFWKDRDANLIRFYGSIQDITAQVGIEEEQRKQAEIMEQMAYFDNLTGLPNRNHLDKWLNEQINNSKTKRFSGVGFFLDLDELKTVNDAYGHSFGDKIIVTASERIKGSMGEQAFVARVGGDAFVVMLRGKCDKKKIEAIAQKTLKNISRSQEHLDIILHITASIGIACYPKDGNTAEEIIKNASNAMIKAKKEGGNSWEFYNKEMQAEAYKKIRLIEGLRYAIARKELSLVYQPQISLARKSVVGVEALLRWKSSEYGYVSPTIFIPLAEQAGLINGIGKWVTEEACSFAQRLTKKGRPELTVAFNVSAIQVAADDFVGMLSHAVTKVGIKPKQMEMEITESLLMLHMDKVILKLNQIKEMGINIALDDFGTGYSSLTKLCRLPIKTLKIDKSFINMIDADGLGAIMIGGIINMAKSINMSVVAEGVETEKQLDYLLQSGCDCIQGYFFSKPLAEKDLYDFLLNFKIKKNC